MCMKIIRRGLFTTLQEASDGGGTVDAFALYAANLLVGNTEGEAALEITLLGPEISFETGALIAICGGDLAPMVDGKPIPNWRPVFVRAGSTLTFTDARAGFRAYLAAAGGFDLQTAPERRTAGSLHLGRPLREGDTLRLKPRSDDGEKFYAKLRDQAASLAFATTSWFVSHEVMPSYNAKRRIRVLKSEDFALFSSASRERVFASPFQMKPETDRRGYRLDGITLHLEEFSASPSTPSPAGALSVREDGAPTITMTPHTHHAPSIARVIPVDFPVLAQVRSGERVTFHEISEDEAHELAYLRGMGLGILKNTILTLQGR
ncbi:hypothetical protein [Tumebacillus flagellatus]|uniref:Carboxyltransferase domain-containing protein n=1 Tax=Tumebacillus flagellatus TaxID=1157490 RepID=A0A074MGH0_9BACL|nr:hypothetical protein [Tumebacillus flagellatus]KEO84812.1 hypothetical protein EL26_02030 [Tumebacillus flagellatus]